MADADLIVGATADGASDPIVMVHNELLCFLQQRCRVLAHDDIVTICVNFYSLKEVDAARLSLESWAEKKRLPIRKGDDKDKCRKTLSDLLKLCLDPSVALPQFYAIDISRLPPVGVDHVDMSALLQELVVLRQGVQMVSQMQSEITLLKSLMTDHINASMSPQCVVSQASSGFGELSPIKGSGARRRVKERSGDLNDQVAGGSRRYSAVAAELIDSGGFQPVSRESSLKSTKLKVAGTTVDLKRQRSIRKVITGAAEHNTHMKVVNTVRSVDIFVSRLHPLTTVSEIIDSVNFAKGDLNVCEINVQKLKSKLEGVYSSFYIQIRVNADLLKRALDVFMNAEAWPTGVFVKRYFKPKNG
jgi:hypothetical protein